MRRLTAATGIAVALLGLAACRAEPDVAAYVGDTKFTEADVAKLAGPVKDQLGRADVVHLLVLDALCKRIATDKGITPPNPAPNPAGTPEIGAIAARVQACVAPQGWLAKSAPPVPATEADIREVYDNGIKVGAINPSLPYEEAVRGLSSEQAQTAIAAGLGSRKVIRDAANAGDVSINPRYGSLDLPVLSFEQGTALAATVGRPNDAVTDAPAATPTAPPVPGS